MSSKKKLSQIKSGIFSRGASLAKVSFNASTQAAKHVIGNALTIDKSKRKSQLELFVNQVEILSQELGQLKGSLMKVGQLLSMYGEYFFPAEVNTILKKLQKDSPPLEWDQIEKVLLKELGTEKLSKLEIEKESLASASLGQVHRAKIKDTGQYIAMKIQYPGVDRAINGDLKALRSILMVSKVLPKHLNIDELFQEIKTMLRQEVDYEKELKLTQEFKTLLLQDPRYIVPEVFPEFSSKKVLSTSYEDGHSFDDPRVIDLPQDRRNSLAETYLELYLNEIFTWKMVQTDPHFGNYRVRLNEQTKQDQIVLFDFGATRKVSKEFRDNYFQLAKSIFLNKRVEFERAAFQFNLIRKDDSQELKTAFWILCQTIMEPILSDIHEVKALNLDEHGVYDWGDSGLPKRVAKMATKMAFSYEVRTPPREFVFLDRKMGGIFILLSVLQAKINVRRILEKMILEGE